MVLLLLMLLLYITVIVQSASSASESVDLVNSSTVKSVVDGPSESVTDSSLPPTTDRSADCSSHSSVQATKHSEKTSCGESNPHDIVARIYREELQKLATAAKTNGNFAEYIMYERELERLAQSSATPSEPVLPISSPAPSRRRKDSRHSSSSKRFALKSIDRNAKLQTVSWPATEHPIVDHPEDLRTRSSQSRVQADSRDTNSLSDVSVLCTPDVNFGRTISTSSTDLASPATDLTVSHQDIIRGDVVVKSEDLSAEADADAQQLTLKVEDDCSPLDLMRTIADSVTSKSHKKSPSVETSRYVLPPITAEQLKQCSYLNTDEVVAAVRSTLADYSISQRLFGEAVLGLSQASSISKAMFPLLLDSFCKTQ